MSGKVKMRCARCGRPFKSSSAKQTLCDSCESKARAERAASKATSLKPATKPAAVAQAPKIVGPGAAILGVAPTLTDTTAPASESGRANGSTFGERSARPERDAPGQAKRDVAHNQHPSHAAQSKPEAGGQASRTHTQKQQNEQKSLKQQKAPTPAVELTDALRLRIEQRYIELAQPTEFDGIRTQIAADLGIPKHIVKRTVLDLRTRKQMPSWWELQAFTGPRADLERIRAAYVPHLPLPPVGIHKKIAADLGLEPLTVYHAIKRIRAEMQLPQYNSPELHAEAGVALPASTASAGAPEASESKASKASAAPSASEATATQTADAGLPQ
jgi:hypothetical protein